MTNLCTKVTVRQRPIKNGQISLYLDFYPAIRHPKTGRLSRREYLGLYIYANPTERFQQEFNRSMLQKAELIKCRRTESIINEEFGFLDRSKDKESFLDYYKEWIKERGDHNSISAYKHFYNYTKGECRFCDLSVQYCQKFLDYLLSESCYYNGKPLMPTTANNNLIKLKTVLKKAYSDKLIREDIASKLKRAKGHGNKREYLTKEELIALANTPCTSDVLRRAGLFSCLTGLRLSDCILLKWEDIKKSSDGGWVLDIVTKKTDTAAILPISEEALELCGERDEGQVFKGLTPNLVAIHLKGWIEASGIKKHITFHCFRHTFATLQLANGTDIYTVSKLLTHSNLATTQVYADVINELKRDAANRISLKADGNVGAMSEDNRKVNSSDNQ